MIDHVTGTDEMVSQPTLFSLEAARMHEEQALPPEQPTTPTRIHPVTVREWTPDLAARYAEQIRLESITQFEQQAVTLRRRAGGDRHSHYWAAADRAQATALRLKEVQRWSI